jgi:ribosomal protein S18 acetylase RimI-like enzyme
MYLIIIGVDPKFQGQGFGSKLLKFGLKKLDETNTPCYLETFKKSNVLIYKHFGFDLLDEAPLPNTDLTLYSMLRLPSTIATTFQDRLV